MITVFVPAIQIWFHKQYKKYKNSMTSNTQEIKQLNIGDLSKDILESDSAGSIKELIQNNSSTKSFGWVGNDLEDTLANLDSFSCDCDYCCGNVVAPDSDFTNTNNNLLDTADTSLFDAASGDVTTVNYSGKNSIDSLIYPAKWTSKTITYSFYDGGSYYDSSRQGKVSEVSNKIKDYLRNILKSFENYVDLKFVEVSDKGDSYGQIRYMNYTGTSSGSTKVPYKYQNSPLAGDIYLSPKIKSQFEEGPGAYRYETLIHETLHALNLKHPGNYNGSSNGGQSGEFLPNWKDNSNNSILSYNRFRNNSDYSGTITAMPYDIRALQYLYGIADYQEGDTVYKFDKIDQYYIGNDFFGNKNSNAKQALWDSAGIDTFDLTGLGSNNSGYIVDLSEGGLVTAKNLYNTSSYKARGDGKTYKATSRGTFLGYDMTIENVISSRSNDYITANKGANTFSGYTKGAIFGNDRISNSDSQDKIDLSSFKVSDFTTSQSGDDYVLDFGASGSIKIKGYYTALESDRIQIVTASGDPTPPDTTTTPPDPTPTPPNPISAPTPTNVALVWENLGFADESAVATGSKLNLGNGVTATVNWEIITDGGNFAPHAGEDYVSFESGKTGNHTGYLSLGFNNSEDDPDDLIKLSLDFGQPVTGLTFKVLDVDQSAGKTFDDGVEIYVNNEVNVKSLLDVEITTGDNVFADNETYMDGFEGRGNAGANNSSEGGNINLNFGSTEVSSLEIRYFSTDDAIANPGSQKIGLSDFNFQVKS